MQVKTVLVFSILAICDMVENKSLTDVLLSTCGQKGNVSHLYPLLVILVDINQDNIDVYFSLANSFCLKFVKEEKNGLVICLNKSLKDVAPNVKCQVGGTCPSIARHHLKSWMSSI